MRKKNWGKTNETLFAKANYDSVHANHQCYERICTGYQPFEHLNRMVVRGMEKFLEKKTF